MQLNKPDLIDLMNYKLPDNTSQEITAEDIRDVLESMIESDQNPNDIGSEAFTMRQGQDDGSAFFRF